MTLMQQKYTEQQKFLLVVDVKALDVTREDVATAVVVDSNVDCVVSVGQIDVVTVSGIGIMKIVEITSEITTLFRGWK